MGGLHDIWTEDFSGQLQRLLQSTDTRDIRAALGRERGGREAASAVIDDVLHA
jgi:malonate decarboxylase gamma subunit